MTKKTKLIIVLPLCLLLGVSIAVVVYHQVPKTITSEDKVYIEKILTASGYEFENLKNPSGFEAELATIRAVQDSILNSTPIQKRIPLGENREPKDLYNRENALCGDRSRFMDKALREAGFETRFAFIVNTDIIDNPLLAFLTSDREKVDSHGVVEVLTSRGWMVVDSVTRWVSMDEDGSVYDLDQLRAKVIGGQEPIWHNSNRGKIYHLLQNDFSYVYGIYSRNGYFYPPFNPVPDVNWSELAKTFF